MKFTYSSGQRPLDGFVLKRGIGRGGFGEVFFAVSDGGKEVALKLLRGNSDIELRGVAQCLNLKHPNLVNLYDLRTDAQGDRWVVMEYVSGEPLSVALSRHPNGLPVELAQQWFLALARAIAYLHDHGIVHRDLKPGNIFLEDGTIKVGDYGLSKSISGSQRTAQTQSVGTIHYMAPEISTGNYNKQIDVYAAGIILYEMLTGRVPFDGESAGEILMKHLTTPPDLTRVPADYLPIVAKALAKNPAHRFSSMSEMARAVENLGREPKVIPVAQPRPRTLPTALRVPPPRARPRPEPIPVVLPVVPLRQQIGELTGSMVLAAGLALLGTIAWGILNRFMGHPGHRYFLSDLGLIFFLAVGASWIVLVPAKFWDQKRGSSWYRRLVMMFLGILLGVSALWLSGVSPGPSWAGPGSLVALVTGDPRSVSRSSSQFFVDQAIKYVGYFALVFFLLRWWRMADLHRARRFSLLPVITAFFWGVLPLPLCPELLPGAAVALVMTAVIVQLVSPCVPLVTAASRRLRLRHT